MQTFFLWRILKFFTTKIVKFERKIFVFERNFLANLAVAKFSTKKNLSISPKRSFTQKIFTKFSTSGFMRKNESSNVESSLSTIGVQLIVKRAFHQFIKGTTTVKLPGSLYSTETPLLSMTINPEDKRKIIGDVFMKVSNEVIRELKMRPEEVFLAQGTLRPDLIESASSLVSTKAETIKTHHNDTELVRKLRNEGRVIEPLKDFHKDEVRQLGYDLGLPSLFVDRHPFPGPGLSIRILCADEAYLEKDFHETQVVVKVIVDYQNKLKKKHALLNRVSGVTTKEEQEELCRISSSIQLQAIVLPIRSVGVQGELGSNKIVKRKFTIFLTFQVTNAPTTMSLAFRAKKSQIGWI